MQNRQTPPGLMSIAWVEVVNPLGPHQCVSWAGSVQARNTSPLGASKTRVATSSRSAAEGSLRIVAPAPESRFAAVIRLLPFLEFLEILVEPIETLVPEPAILREPVGDLPERPGLEAA